MVYTKTKIKTSALITIDTQNDFTLQGAPAKIPGTREIIPNMKQLLNWYRDHDLPIIHMIRIYLPDGSNVDLCRKEMIESGARIVCPGSEGVELMTTESCVSQKIIVQDAAANTDTATADLGVTHHD